MKIMGKIRSYFLRGFAVLLPTIITIWIFVWGYQFIQENISVHINRGIVKLIMFSKNYKGEAVKEVLEDFWIEGTGSIAGFVIALIGVCIIGAILASVVGKTIGPMIEKFIMRTPFLKGVYPYIKQVTDFFLARAKEEKISFSRVVAAEYPRKGIWSVGMVTGDGLREVVDDQRKEMLTVFIPTSPTPFTGFVIMIPRKQTIELDMSIEEAFRFTVSGGVITPDQMSEKMIFPEEGMNRLQGE